jgi:hypothetical protein
MVKLFLYVLFFTTFSMGSGDVYHSLETSVEEKVCHKVEELQVDRLLQSKLGEYILACPAPKGYILYLIDDGTRSWYVIEHKQRKVSLEEEIVYKNQLGNFPNVGVEQRVKWEVGPDGLVQRFMYSVTYVRLDENGRHHSFSQKFSADIRGVKPIVTILK